LTNSIRAFFRAPEWKDSFDNARHERRLLGVGSTAMFGWVCSGGRGEVRPLLRPHLSG
jgi:hypothetical protein